MCSVSTRDAGESGARCTFSRMKPRTLSSHLHRAQIMKTSLGENQYRHAMQTQARTYATGAFEIHVLDPLMTNPPSTSVAVVSIPAGSEPWLGSVRPCIVLINGFMTEHGIYRVCSCQPHITDKLV